MKQWTKAVRRGILLVLVVLACTATAWAASYTAQTEKEFYGAIEQALAARETDFAVTYTGGEPGDLPGVNERSIGMLARQAGVLSEDKTGMAGDYVSLSLSEGKVLVVNDTVYCKAQYLTTLEQEAVAAAKVDAILQELSLEELDEYSKIKVIYEYIGSTYTYDQTLEKFSAYDGLTTGSMVCQGYALLTYQMMWKAGIPCHIITGTSKGENHAWNIVQLDGKWYNLDCTWDAADDAGQSMYWNYFLKSDDAFPDHTASKLYTSAEHRAAFPRAETSYPLSRVEIHVNGSYASALTLRTGVTADLSVLLDPPTDNQAVTWVSSDPTIVSVTPDGKATGLALGSVTVSAIPVDAAGYIAGTLPITTVDLTTCSAWASEELTAAYLSRLLPASLCSNFTSPITRAEMARLLCQYCRMTVGLPGGALVPDYTDIAGNADAFYIMICRDLGLMEGMSDTIFSPNTPVTRAQAAKILTALAAHVDLTVPSGHTESFADAKEIAPWAQESVGAAVQMELLKGYEDGTFRPNESLTREQAAVILYRLYTQWEQLRANAA